MPAGATSARARPRAISTSLLRCLTFYNAAATNDTAGHKLTQRMPGGVAPTAPAATKNSRSRLSPPSRTRIEGDGRQKFGAQNH